MRLPALEDTCLSSYVIRMFARDFIASLNLYNSLVEVTGCNLILLETIVAPPGRTNSTALLPTITSKTVRARGN